MSIGNQKFGVPRKYICILYLYLTSADPFHTYTKSVFGISVPIFFGIFLVFYRYFEEALVKNWYLVKN